MEERTKEINNEEWGVIAVHLMKLYSFADGFHVNIYITLQGKILCKGHK